MSSTTGACIPGCNTSGPGEPGGRSMKTWISHCVPLVMTPIVGSGGCPGFPTGGGPTGGGGVGVVTTAHCSGAGGGALFGGTGPPVGGGAGEVAAATCR